MTIALWILFISLAFLQVMDFYTTKRILDRGGYEKAKIMIWLMSKLGTNLAMILTKSMMLSLMGTFIYSFGHTFPLNMLLMALMVVAITLYIEIISDNLKIYKEFRCL